MTYFIWKVQYREIREQVFCDGNTKFAHYRDFYDQHALAGEDLKSLLEMVEKEVGRTWEDEEEGKIYRVAEVKVLKAEKICQLNLGVPNA